MEIIKIIAWTLGAVAFALLIAHIAEFISRLINGKNK